MAADFTIRRGDTLPTIAATLKDANGTVPTTPIPNGTTVRFHLQAWGGGALAVNQQAVIVDAAGWRVRYDWQPGDTAVADLYRAEWELTFPDGKVETFPNGSDLVVEIRKDLA